MVSVLSAYNSADLVRIAASLSVAILMAVIAYRLAVQGTAVDKKRLDWLTFGALASAAGFWAIHLIAVQNAFVAVACTMFAFALIASALSRRITRQSRDLERNEEYQRITLALNEQRVTRLQNEALIEEIHERQKVEAQLSRLVYQDPLTGLNNRTYLAQKIAECLKPHRGRDTTRAVLLYIDLDNFKSVNDMLGHRFGDMLLTEMAARLRHCAREHDVLARMGGDEFTLLLLNLQSVEQAYRLAQRILNVMEDPIDLAGVRFPITASIGLCELNGGYDQADDVLRDADTAMYSAKHEGGSRAVIYNPSMHDDALAALQAKMQLKSAVENSEFELYYQPLVHLADRSIYGMEALIRWNHPTKGVTGPGAFIDLAEETGHIIAIGSWVLRQACFDLQSLQQSCNHDLLLSLNVSSRQLDEPNFLRDLRKTLKDTEVNPQSIQLEITESVFLKDAVRIGHLFQEIRALGVKIAFDDFGTGYSSLSYLERYPIDTLKIDQSFVQNMKPGSINADIVQLVIDLAKAIGMGVTAEGVEEPDQAAALLGFGCQLAQGYLYSRPVQLQRMMEIVKYGLPVARRLARVV